MGRNQRDESGKNEYTVTSFSASRTLAGNEGTAANISAVVTTLINDLIEAGVISGSVS